MATEGRGEDLDLFMKFKDILRPSFEHLEAKIDQVFHREANRVLLWLAVGLLGSIGTVAVTVWSASQRYGHLRDAVEKELPKQMEALRAGNEEFRKSLDELRRAVNDLKERSAVRPRSSVEVPNLPPVEPK